MPKNIIVLTGSARPNSASTKVAELVASRLSECGAKPEIVEVSNLNLPFFDAPMPPSAEDYEITDENVKAWSEKLLASDGIVFVMPEYNHSISAIQKNAIDWLYNEWTDKPLAMVAYGFYAGANVLEAMKLPLKVIKPDVRGEAGLGFGSELEIDGSVKGAEATASKLDPLRKELVK